MKQWFPTNRPHLAPCPDWPPSMAGAGLRAAVKTVTRKEHLRPSSAVDKWRVGACGRRAEDVAWSRRAFPVGWSVGRGGTLVGGRVRRHRERQLTSEWPVIRNENCQSACAGSSPSDCQYWLQCLWYHNSSASASSSSRSSSAVDCQWWRCLSLLPVSSSLCCLSYITSALRWHCLSIYASVFPGFCIRYWCCQCFSYLSLCLTWPNYRNPRFYIFSISASIIG